MAPISNQSSSKSGVKNHLKPGGRDERKEAKGIEKRGVVAEKCSQRELGATQSKKPQSLSVQSRALDQDVSDRKSVTTSGTNRPGANADKEPMGAISVPGTKPAEDHLLASQSA